MSAGISIGPNSDVVMRRAFADMLGAALRKQLRTQGELEEELEYMLRDANADQLDLTRVEPSHFRAIARATTHHADAVFRYELPQSLNPFSYRDYAGELCSFECALYDDPRCAEMIRPPPRDPSTPIKPDVLALLFLAFLERTDPGSGVFCLQHAVRNEEPGLRIVLEHLVEHASTHEVAEYAHRALDAANDPQTPVAIPWRYVGIVGLVVLGCVGFNTSVPKTMNWWVSIGLMVVPTVVMFLSRARPKHHIQRAVSERPARGPDER